MSVKRVLLVSPRGFCAGVARAVKAVEDTLSIFSSPVYVKHEIVHNVHVVADLEKKGAITIDDLIEVPDGAAVVFSAHGSTPKQYVEARKRGLRVVDATCPLVTKVHLEMQRFIKDGYEVVYIGHQGHIEGVGVIAEAEGKNIPVIETVEDVEKLDIGHPKKIAYLTQTTLSISDTEKIIQALKKKYPKIVAPPLSDICFATTNRQEAIRALAKVVDMILIFGSKTSSNSTRLMETARAEGAQAHLIDDISKLDKAWLTDVETVGISAGASVPEKLVQGAVNFFVSQGAAIEDFIVKAESMAFAEPLELMQMKKTDRGVV